MFMLRVLVASLLALLSDPSSYCPEIMIIIQTGCLSEGHLMNVMLQMLVLHGFDDGKVKDRAVQLRQVLTAAACMASDENKKVCQASAVLFQCVEDMVESMDEYGNFRKLVEVPWVDS
ncbi:unnamed protein product, partial [Symbiodinium sp. CCMP2592]